MSRMINSTADVLPYLTGDENWYKIIKDSNNIRIDSPATLDKDDYIKEDPDSCWDILDRDGVCIHSDDQYVQEVQEKPALSLQNPRDFFIFEYKNSEELKAARSYGSTFFSSKNLSVKSISRKWKYYTENQNTPSWKDFLKKLHTQARPQSNALIIIDRYIFSYDKATHLDYHNGIQNIYDLLSELLPDNINTETVFQIMIVFDEETVSRGTNITEISQKLQKMKRLLCKPYHISIELVSISRDQKKDIYSATHDRKIISNNYIITATHGFNAFTPEHPRTDGMIETDTSVPRKSLYNQTLEFECIYADIDDEDADEYPIDNCDLTLSSLKDILEANPDNKNITVVRNGNPRISTIAQLDNRLIR